MLMTMFAGLIVLTGSLAASIATGETINVSDAHGGRRRPIS